MPVPEVVSFKEAMETGDWIAYERTRPHYDPGDGWCRCTCDVCEPHGCSHSSNPSPCVAHPEPGR